MDIRSEQLVAFMPTEVSALDGIPYTTQAPAVSAYLGTMLEWLIKQNNRVLTPSACLASGGSAGAVLLQAPTSVGVSAYVALLYQGAPYHLMSAAQISGAPASNASPGYSTTSTTIRKVLVGLTLSALPLASSPGSNGGATMVFVYGSAYAVSAGVVTSGGASAYFNLVPLPKPSAGMIPLGWLNIPNSHAASAGLADHMLITDFRQTQGFDLSAIQGVIRQP